MEKPERFQDFQVFYQVSVDTEPPPPLLARQGVKNRTHGVISDDGRTCVCVNARAL